MHMEPMRLFRRIGRYATAENYPLYWLNRPGLSGTHKIKPQRVTSDVCMVVCEVDIKHVAGVSCMLVVSISVRWHTNGEQQCNIAIDVSLTSYFIYWLHVDTGHVALRYYKNKSSSQLPYIVLYFRNHKCQLTKLLVDLTKLLEVFQAVQRSQRSCGRNFKGRGIDFEYYQSHHSHVLALALSSSTVSSIWWAHVEASSFLIQSVNRAEAWNHTAIRTYMNSRIHSRQFNYGDSLTAHAQPQCLCSWNSD